MTFTSSVVAIVIENSSYNNRRVSLGASEYQVVRNAILQCWMHPQLAS